MKNEIRRLIIQAHENAINKGFWPEGIKNDYGHKDQTLFLIITELAEAVEALRKGKNANVVKFTNLYTEETFSSCFELYVKNTVEDEFADTFIRLCDYAGAYDVKSSVIKKYFEAELEALAGIKITNITSHILTITKTIIDIKYYPWTAQYIGEAMAKIYYFMQSTGKDLYWHVEWKMKYNSLREHKHGKQF